MKRRTRQLTPRYVCTYPIVFRSTIVTIAALVSTLAGTIPASTQETEEAPEVRVQIGEELPLTEEICQGRYRSGIDARLQVGNDYLTPEVCMGANVTLYNIPAGTYQVVCNYRTSGWHSLSPRLGHEHMRPERLISHDGRSSATYENVCGLVGNALTETFQYQYLRIDITDNIEFQSGVLVYDSSRGVMTVVGPYVGVGDLNGIAILVQQELDRTGSGNCEYDDIPCYWISLSLEDFASGLYEISCVLSRWEGGARTVISERSSAMTHDGRASLTFDKICSVNASESGDGVRPTASPSFTVSRTDRNSDDEFHSDWLENPIYGAGRSGGMPEVFVSLGASAASAADCPDDRLPCSWLDLALKNLPSGRYRYECTPQGGFDFYMSGDDDEARWGDLYPLYRLTRWGYIDHEAGGSDTYRTSCLHNLGKRFGMPVTVHFRRGDGTYFEHKVWPYLSAELEEYYANDNVLLAAPDAGIAASYDDCGVISEDSRFDENICKSISVTLSKVPAGDYLLMCFHYGIEHGLWYIGDATKIAHDGRNPAVYAGCRSGGGNVVVLGYWSDSFSGVTGADEAIDNTGSEGVPDASPPGETDPGVVGEVGSVEGSLAPSVPGVPRDLRLVFVRDDGAGVGGDEFEIGWEPPYAGDGGAVRDYVVSVSRPSVPDVWFASWVGLLLGPVEESFSTSLTSMRFEGAHSATYTVSVAARNANGVGPAVTGEIRTRRGPWTCAVDPGQRKYELTTTGGWGWPWKVGSVTRVKALQDFTTVHGLRVSKGVEGGQVEGAHNLSQEGCSWIAYGASVSDNAVVSGHGVVAGNARVEDKAIVKDMAVVSGEAKLYDDAKVYGSARVAGSARIDDRARVYGSAEVSGNAHIYDTAAVYEYARVLDRGRVYHSAEVYGRAEVSGDADVYGEEGRRRYLEWAEVRGDAVIKGDARIHGSAIVSGEVEFSGDVNINEGEYDGDVEYLRAAAGLVQAVHEDNAALFRRCTSRARWSEREIQQAARHVVEAMVFGETTSVDHQVSSIIRDECLKWEAIVELLEDVAPNGAELALQYGLQLLRAANLSRMTQTILDFADGLNDIRDLINARDYIETASEKLAVSSGENLRLQLMNGSLRAIEDDRIRFTEVDGDIRIQGQLRDGSWRYF